jgi:hypothetical protein
MKTKILFLWIVLLMGAATSFAEEVGGKCGENLTWILSEGTLTISGTGAMSNYSSSNVPWYSYRNSIKTVIIEDGVTSIGNDAFVGYGYANLTSVTIGNSVTSIGNYAFCECYNLTLVTIPNSVISIGNYAFYGCNLTSVTIPNSVTNIGDGAFDWCSSLTAIDVSEDNTAYSSENGVLFNKEKTILVQYPEGKPDVDYAIPNSVTDIGDWAFDNCDNLTSVTIPNSVTDIGNGAFAWCSSLTSVINLHPTPQNIASNVFNSVNLNNATLYVPAESVEDYRKAPVWTEFSEIIPYVPSAIHAPTAENAIRIYPNPVRDILHIANAPGLEKRLYNLTGKLVAVTQDDEIDLSGYPGGIYLLHVDGRIVKVVKGN